MKFSDECVFITKYNLSRIVTSSIGKKLIAKLMISISTRNYRKYSTQKN